MSLAAATNPSESSPAPPPRVHHAHHVWAMSRCVSNRSTAFLRSIQGHGGGALGQSIRTRSAFLKQTSGSEEPAPASALAATPGRNRRPQDSSLARASSRWALQEGGGGGGGGGQAKAGPRTSTRRMISAPGHSMTRRNITELGPAPMVAAQMVASGSSRRAWLQDGSFKSSGPLGVAPNAPAALPDAANNRLLEDDVDMELDGHGGLDNSDFRAVRLCVTRACVSRVLGWRESSWLSRLDMQLQLFNASTDWVVGSATASGRPVASKRRHKSSGGDASGNAGGGGGGAHGGGFSKVQPPAATLAPATALHGDVPDDAAASPSHRTRGQPLGAAYLQASDSRRYIKDGNRAVTIECKITICNILKWLMRLRLDYQMNQVWWRVWVAAAAADGVF